jgi:hypothetical protein
MTDERAIKSGSKYDRDRLKRPEDKLEYANQFVTCVEESDKNNINRQTLQKIITGTVGDVIGKIEGT